MIGLENVCEDWLRDNEDTWNNMVKGAQLYDIPLYRVENDFHSYLISGKLPHYTLTPREKYSVEF